MLKWLPLFLGLFSLQTIPIHAQTLKVGYFDLPPHAFSDQTQVSAALNYFDKVAEEMGVKVEYRHLPLQRLLFMVEHQQLDAALFLARNTEREALFVFPSLPLFQVHAVYVVGAASNLQTPADINREHSLQIGVWQGGYQSSTLANSNNQLIPLSGNNVAARGIELVTSGRFDAFYSPDKYAVEFAAHQNGMEAKIRIIPNAKEAIPLYTVFNKKAAPLYLQKFEQALKKVQTKYNYNALLEQVQQNSFLQRD